MHKADFDLKSHTFGSSEVDGVRQRADSFSILGLNPEIINRVKIQINHLVGQPVATDCLHYPVVYRHVLIQRVVQDVTCKTGKNSKYDQDITKQDVKCIHRVMSSCQHYVCLIIIKLMCQLLFCLC